MSYEVLSILWKVILFVVIFLLIATHWVADSMLFHQFPSTYQNDHRYFAVETENEVPIACRFLSNQASPYLIIYSHGNGEDLGHIEGLLKGFRQNGLNILAYDYPGYGLSGGKPTEKGCYEAIRAVTQFAVTQLGFAPERIVFFGRSLGGGPAIEMCRNGEYGGLILESVFTSAFSVGIGIGWLPWDRFKNLEKIRKIDEPTLVMHGSQDEVVPFSHGKRLFEALESPKLYYWAQGAGHNNLAAFLGEEYWAIIRDFVRYLDAE